VRIEWFADNHLVEIGNGSGVIFWVFRRIRGLIVPS
jgi:hypothetical protein